MSIFCVALTGGLAGGKSLTADFFAARGVAVVDADEIAHNLSGPKGKAIPALRKALGAWAIDDNDSMKRDLVRKRAFADIDIRRLLESVLHPPVRAEMVRLLAEVQNAPYAMAVIPLLFETNMLNEMIHRVLVVDCEKETQITRASRRPGLSLDDITAILAAQVGRDKRLAMADDVINNDGDKTQLEVAVEKLHQNYIKLAQNQKREGK